MDKKRILPYSSILLLWGAVPFGLIGVITFSMPNFDPSGKMIYAYITYTLMMMVNTIVNVPYASLLGVMTEHTKGTNDLVIISVYRCLCRGNGDDCLNSSIIGTFQVDGLFRCPWFPVVGNYLCNYRGLLFHHDLCLDKGTLKTGC